MLTEGSSSWCVVADSAAEVVFLAEDNNARVPNTLDVLAHELARELGSHAL